jgi:hypothetical protein
MSPLDSADGLPELLLEPLLAVDDEPLVLPLLDVPVESLELSLPQAASNAGNVVAPTPRIDARLSNVRRLSTIIPTRR